MSNRSSLPLFKRILKGSAIVLLFTVLSSPLGYLVRMIFAHAMSIESYGLLYAMIGFFWIFVTFNDLGFGYSVIYMIPKLYRQKEYQSCWNIFIYDLLIEVGSALCISIFLLLLSPFLSTYYFKVGNLSAMIGVFCIYFIVNSYASALNKFYTGLQEERLYSSMEFVRLTCTVITAMLLWFVGKSEDAFPYAISWVGGYIAIACVYTLPLLWKKEFIHLSPRWDYELFTRMRILAIPTLLSSSVVSFISITDVIFLTYFRGVSQVGLYNVILPIVSISVFILAPISHFLLPLTSELIEGNTHQVKQLLRVIVRVIPFIGMYFATFIAIFANASVSFLFGNKWGPQATLPVSIFAFGFVPNLLAQYLGTIMSGMGKVKDKLQVSIIIGIVSLIGNSLGASLGGIIGVILTNTMIYILSVYLYTRSLHTSIGFSLPFWEYTKTMCIFATLAICISLLKLDPNTWIEFVSIGIIYSMIVGGIGLLLFSQERAVLLQFLHHNGRKKGAVSLSTSFEEKI